MKFYIRNLPNLLVRFFSFDRFYVCDACKKIHKRDGKEIRFDDGNCGSLLASRWWYPSVCSKGFEQTIKSAISALWDDADRGEGA